MSDMDGLSQVTVVVKNNITENNVMLCEVDDSDLEFTGDSGAIGRIFSSHEMFRLDLKGRQYSGTITSGPVVMILNLSSNQTLVGKVSVGKVETVVNEFCQLNFERDLYKSVSGIYTGGKELETDCSDEEVERNKQYERDASDESEDQNNDRKSLTITKKGKAKPNISTITQRKRKSSKVSVKKSSRK